VKRRHAMSFGAECLSDGAVRFRLWAPKARRVSLCLADGSRALVPMIAREEGWFEITTVDARPGSRYRFEIDGRVQVPDPASRFQPEDVHGPSEVIDPADFDWGDEDWHGRAWEESVLYELHVGAFSPVGTFGGVRERLRYLVDLGITAIELMPVADFPGERNWGYDGVLPFAPDASYGRPNDLKHLIQAAHQSGLMVFLDVVYNHFGPEGNYLREYAPQFFTDRYRTPWGEALNFGGPGSRVVRDFFIQNALYWLNEFHFDGLRLDAVHLILDESQPHFLNELAQTVRAAVPSNRRVHLVLENDANESRYLQRRRNREAVFYDAQWNDDIHHVLHVALTGECDGYYEDYADHTLQRLGHCLAEGFDYQGQPSRFRDFEKRGEPSRDLPPEAFVSFLQNHDQVGNRAFGERISQLAPAAAVEAAMAILLLAPSPPLLFMGEEFGARTPFLFFCDFGHELAQAVREGRRNEFARFKRFSDPAVREKIPDPNEENTFLASKLAWNSIGASPEHNQFNFYKRLLAIRCSSIVPLIPQIRLGAASYTVLDDQGVSVVWPMTNGGELRLAANLSDRALACSTSPETKLLFSTSGSSRMKPEMVPWEVRWTLAS